MYSRLQLNETIRTCNVHKIDDQTRICTIGSKFGVCLLILGVFACAAIEIWVFRYLA